MDRIIILVLLASALGENKLDDGQPVRTTINSESGGSETYVFHTNSLSPGKDLSVTLTTYSDSEKPRLYMSANSTVSDEKHDWTTEGSSILLSSAEVKNYTDYHILVLCPKSCQYTLTASCNSEIQLKDGEPVQGSVQSGGIRVYQFKTGDVPPMELETTVTPEDNDATFTMRLTTDAAGEYLVEDSWHRGKSCRISPVISNTVYYISISTDTTLDFTIVYKSFNEAQDLQASVPTQGKTATGQFAFYKINVDNQDDSLIIQLTIYSGSADILVQSTLKPTATAYQFRSDHDGNETLSISKHQRTQLECETGLFFIGVLGHSQAVFTITASLNPHSWVPLFNGLPQHGYADFNETDYYYMSIPPGKDLNLTIRVNAMYGDPDLYVWLCIKPKTDDCLLTQEMETHPDQFPTLFTSRHSTGDESVFLRHLGSQCPTHPCKYSIGILGSANSRTRFSVVASSDEGLEHVLLEGTPMTMSMAEAGYLYFKYTVFNATVNRLTVQVTPVSGEPDLYVTRNPQLPSNSSFEKSSRESLAFGHAVDYIRGEDGKTLNGIYHISVYSRSITSFSIVAIERLPGRNTTLLLYPGKSQQDTLYGFDHAGYRLYSFDVHYTEATKEQMRVTLTPLSGKYEMYIANNPAAVDMTRELFYFQWCTCNDPTNKTTVITIDPKSPDYLIESTYLILVKALFFAQDESASYMITYSPGNALVSLRESIPYADQVELGKYKSYAFPIHYVHEDIRISVLAMSGDPDLYISFTETNPRPTKEFYDFFSSTHGGEVYQLQWEQGIRNVCPQPLGKEFGEAVYCLMYISVYGHSASSYTITISIREGLPNLLILGFPATGELSRMDWKYYFTLVQSNQPLSVSLQSSYGNSNLYLNLLDYNSSGNDMTKWLRPDLELNQYYSAKSSLLDSIDLLPSFFNATCPSGTCIALTGVYCQSIECRYSITCTQKEQQELIDGEPKIGYVSADEYVYFSFYNWVNATSLTIFLTSLSSGDPDFFVSKGIATRPTISQTQWSSLGHIAKRLVIALSDPFFQSEPGMLGYYTIGVTSNSSTTFALTVSTSPTPIVALFPRVPTEGHTSILTPSYYKYTHLDTSELLIRVTPLEGSAQIRVNALVHGNDDINDLLPTDHFFTWASETSGVKNSIRIQQNEPLKSYLIGVFADRDFCRYTLTVSTALAHIILLNGIPAQGRVSKGEWLFYSFLIETDSNFDVSLTSYDGNADLFLSSTSTVSDLVYNWTQATSNRVDHIHLDKSLVRPGTYTIGIRGNESTSFSITAHSGDTAIALIDGWPQDYTVMYSDKDYLQFQYPVLSIVSVKCRLRSLSQEFWPTVTVLVSNHSEFKDNQTIMHLDKEGYEYIYKTLTFVVKSQGIRYFRIEVHGSATPGVDSEESGSFELSCFGGADFTVIRSGDTVTSQVSNETRTQRYEVYVSELSTLEVVVVPCRGRVELSISSNYTKLTEGNADIVVSRPIDGRILGSVQNALGQYYLTVSILQPQISDADFELSVVMTQNGKPLPGKIIPGNDGILTWELIERDKISLSWAPAMYENGDSISSLSYLVYATDNPDIKLTTVCGIRNAQNSSGTWLAISGLLVDTEANVSLPQDKPITLNVVAQVFARQNTLLNAVPYTPTEVILRNSGRRGIGVWVAVLGIALLLTLVALGVYHLRVRRVKKELIHQTTKARGELGLEHEKLEIEQSVVSKPNSNPPYAQLEMTQI